MTQTVNGMAFVNAIVFASPDGTTWTDFSGHGASVETGGAERNTGEVNTFDGLKPIVKGGDRVSEDVTVNYVYTEDDTPNPFDVAWTAHQSASGEFWCQWRAQTGGNWFKTGSGIIKYVPPPQGDAGSGEVILSRFFMKCAGVTEAAAST